jgi:hypothetical protein
MIVAYGDADGVRRVALGAEEESVPLACEERDGDADALARAAATDAASGIGVGVDAMRAVLRLAAWPHAPYVDTAAADARRVGHAAARLVKRVPMT